jgi:hypothetical protein
LQYGTGLVAFVKRAGHTHELEGFAVAGAPHVRAGTEIPEVAVFVEGDFLAFGDVVEQINLKNTRHGALADEAEASALRQCHRLVATDHHALERIIVLDDFFHLLLDAREIIRADAVLQLHVIVKAVFHRWSGSELHIRPYPRDRSRHDVRTGVTQALQLGHFKAFF